MKEFAESRGGKCLSTPFHDQKTRLKWRCGFGHDFEASPTLVKSGHWCPECVPPPWRWDDIAKVDYLFGQFYYKPFEGRTPGNGVAVLPERVKKPESGFQHGEQQDNQIDRIPSNSS